MRFVAFLRAINVGGRNVKMEKLRRIFESVGLTDVQTVIASGNVVFDAKTRNAKTIEKKLQNGLEKSLGYIVTTYVRSLEELAEIASYKPFKKMPKDGKLFVAFASDAPTKEAQKKLLSVQTRADKFCFRDRETYWLCLTRFSESKFAGPLLEKTLGMRITVRNFATITRIAQPRSPNVP